MDKLVCQFEKNSREEIRVQLREFKGHQLLDIRTFYFTSDAGEPKPSPKGISLSIKLLPQLKEAILEAERLLNEQGGLSDDEKTEAEEGDEEAKEEAKEE